MGRILAFLLCGGLIASPAWPRVHDARPGSVFPVQPASSATSRDAPGHVSPTAADAIAARELSGLPRRGSAPHPVAPIRRALDEPRPAWGGSIGLMERYVRQLLERAAAAHRHNGILRPPARPQQRDPAAGPGRAGEPIIAPDDAAALPTRLAFGPASPNPSTGRVTLRVDLPTTAVARVTIVDLAGRVVDQITGPREAGRHTLTWSGGTRAPRSGIYFARLEVDGRPVGILRLVVLR